MPRIDLTDQELHAVQLAIYRTLRDGVATDFDPDGRASRNTSLVTAAIRCGCQLDDKPGLHIDWPSSEALENVLAEAPGIGWNRWLVAFTAVVLALWIAAAVLLVG